MSIDPQRVLVTGASGFVGAALCSRLASTTGVEVRAAVRNASQRPVANAGVEQVGIQDLGLHTDWGAVLEGVDSVVHCAARVHVMSERAQDPLAQFRHVNVDGTLSLARQASQAGVRRFVFVSSIKVNGEQTWPGQAFHAGDVPAPVDPYGISKLEAEQALLQLAQDTPMQVVIVRPVLVYGPGVKANFRSMMQWLDKGIPLPLGGIHENRRSMVSIDNLVDLLALCTTHPAAAGQVFLAADGEDLSTTELLTRTAHALGRSSPRLLPIPASWLIGAARLLGKPGLAQRLCGSLQADISKNRVVLGWVPPTSVEVALARTAQAYRRGG